MDLPQRRLLEDHARCDAQRFVERRARHRMNSDTITGIPHHADSRPLELKLAGTDGKLLNYGIKIVYRACQMRLIER